MHRKSRNGATPTLVLDSTSQRCVALSARTCGEQYLRVARWGAASKGKHDIRDLLVKATAMLLAAGDTWDRSVEEANDEQ